MRVDSDGYYCDIRDVNRKIIDRFAGGRAKLEITINIQTSKSIGFDEVEVRTFSEKGQFLTSDVNSDSTFNTIETQ